MNHIELKINGIRVKCAYETDGEGTVTDVSEIMILGDDTNPYALMEWAFNQAQHIKPPPYILVPAYSTFLRLLVETIQKAVEERAEKERKDAAYESYQFHKGTMA